MAGIRRAIRLAYNDMNPPRGRGKFMPKPYGSGEDRAVTVVTASHQATMIHRKGDETMTFETILLDIDESGVARLTLNRPETHNAMNARMLDEIPEAVSRIADDDRVRVVVLSGAGATFCAGGDLRWMADSLHLPPEKRLAESRRIAILLGALDGLDRPVIGRINGPAFGGGVGLMAVCDVVIAVADARFALTEVRLGLLPANIGPYVITRLGAANARHICLNARPFDAEEGRRLGLISQVVAPDALDEAVAREIALVLKCGPRAVAATKALIAHIDRHGAAESIDYAMAQLAEIWDGAESAEGIAAFLEKRKPSWA